MPRGSIEINCSLCSNFLTMPVQLGCGHYCDLDCIITKIKQGGGPCALDHIPIQTSAIKFSIPDSNSTCFLTLNLSGPAYMVRFPLLVHPSTEVQRLKKVLCILPGIRKMLTLDAFITNALTRLTTADASSYDAQKIFFLYSLAVDRVIAVEDNFTFSQYGFKEQTTYSLKIFAK